MRLPGDVACFVELSNVSVVPESGASDAVAYIRGGDGTVACAVAPTPGSAWMVSISGGERLHPLRVGDAVLVRGIHRATGDRFAVPVRLVCTATGDIARFALPYVPAARAPSWASAT